MKQQMIAVVRLKGNAGMPVGLRKTYELLRLYKKYHCIVIPNTPEYIGMLTKVRDSATWGEIDRETCRLILEKRGRLPGNQRLDEGYAKKKLGMTIDQFVEEVLAFKKQLKDLPGLKLFFKLTPPVRGFESKGVKEQYSLGGSLGYRKDKINELIKRMV